MGSITERTASTTDLWCSLNLKFEGGLQQNRGKFGVSCTSAQSTGVYQITLTSLRASHTCSPREKVQTETQNLLSTSANSSASACLGCTEWESRQTDTGYLKNTAQNLWVGVWICAKERKRRLPVEWRRGSGASFLSSWSTDGSLNTSEHQRCWRMPMGPPPHTPPPLLLRLPSLTSKSKTEAGRWRRRAEEYEAWEEGSVGCD